VRKRAESSQHLFSLRKVATRQLTDHEGMCPDLPLLQQRNQPDVASTQMIDPDGGIDQHLAR